LRKLYNETAPQKTKTIGTATDTATSITRSTITDDEFAAKLQYNKIIVAGNPPFRLPDDIEALKKSLNKRLQSGLPDEQAFRKYEACLTRQKNKMTVMQTIYPQIAEPAEERVCLGYHTHTTIPWSKVDSPLTDRIYNTKADRMESFYGSEYPHKAADKLAGFLIPTAEDVAMPTFAVEFKNSEGMLSPNNTLTF
jgi:hypothetical protein